MTAARAVAGQQVDRVQVGVDPDRRGVGRGGRAAPGAVAGCGFTWSPPVVLTAFSVGYVAMARKKTTAGGFYSYISHGLGRELGIGTGYGAVVAYSVFEASLCGGFAYFLGLKLNAFGVNIAWPRRADDRDHLGADLLRSSGSPPRRGRPAA